MRDRLEPEDDVGSPQAGTQWKTSVSHLCVSALCVSSTTLVIKHVEFAPPQASLWDTS